ncbi:MAG: hypothetical protein R6U56_09100 [Opitutales bacterium]
MTDEKFTELVNLYFDKEISAEDLEELKSEIAARPDRKRAFAERCRLHKAMRMALKPKRARSGRRSSTRSRRSASGGRRSKSRAASSPTKVSRFDASFNAASEALLPRWLLAAGVAASLTIGFLLLPPVFRDTTDPAALPALVGVSEEELAERDPLADLGKSELRRYAVARQQREAKYHASLAAQMRLMGLRPELTPENKQLREVRQAAHYEPKHEVSQAELFQRLQAQKTMPDPQLLRIREMDRDGARASWSGTFEASKARFE